CLKFKKRENRKIFELQKIQCALPAAMRVCLLMGKNDFYKPFYPLKSPCKNAMKFTLHGISYSLTIKLRKL
ncbi:MAG: hypothetical protein ACJAVF_003131, partial [Paraglaciecola sp.]